MMDAFNLETKPEPRVCLDLLDAISASIEEINPLASLIMALAWLSVNSLPLCCSNSLMISCRASIASSPRHVGSFGISM